MKIVAVTFDYDSAKRYDILAKVLKHSIEKNCPKANFELIKIPAPKNQSLKRCFASNTVKLKEWLRVMKTANDDVVFIDCDMILLNDISDAFQCYSFDIGLSKRDCKTIPYNGGLVFVRNTPQAHAFIELWDKINERMYKDYKFHAPWRQKYAGMNQAALGYILEKEKYAAKIKTFPCRTWNLCREDWPFVSGSSKIIHVKSELRRLVFTRTETSRMPKKYIKCVHIWRKYAEEIGFVIADNARHESESVVCSTPVNEKRNIDINQYLGATRRILAPVMKRARQRRVLGKRGKRNA